MTAYSPVRVDFSAWPSWPLRLARWRDTPFLRDCLESIRDDADRTGCGEWACEAQHALDTDDLTDLDALVAEQAAAEEEQSRAYRFECRTGRDYPTDLTRAAAMTASLYRGRG